METKKVITSIDSRMGKRGRRQTFSFSGVEAQEHIDKYMEEVRMTKADLETYQSNASASAAAAAASEENASTSEANSKASETAAAKSAKEALDAVDKVVVATDGVVEKCQEAAEEATASAESAVSSATSAQSSAEAAQKAADQAGAAVVGVASFNGRGGAVMPQAGDYTADMVGAVSEDDLNTISEDLTAINTKVTTLVGSDSGKSVRTISAEELAAQLIPANAQESLDTLKEIAAWIQSHPDEAAAMNEQISALKTTVSGKADKATTLSGYGITDAVKSSDVTSTYSATGTAPVNGKAVASAISGKADTASTVKGVTISGKTVTVTFGDNTTKAYTTQDTTYSNATTSAAGLMSASDKVKLNGIATGATKVTIDSALSATSTNPVQNAVINTALSGKADTVDVTALQSSVDDITTEVSSMPIIRKLATQTLEATGGTLTFTDNEIGDDSLIDVYASIPNIAPSEITQSGTTVTVTFDAQDAAFDVAIIVMT